MTKGEISAHLTRVLIEVFEVAPERITPSALLADDLKIDSIDAVDLELEMNELTGKRLSAEEFKAVRTVQDVIDAVARSVEETR